MSSRGFEVLAAMTEDDVMRIHVEAGKGGRRGLHRGTGVKNRARLTQLVGDLHKAASEKKPMIEIIVTLFDDIERDPQPFQDCNHRTAMLLGRFVARQFGFNLKYSGPEGEKLRRGWENMGKKELRKWIDTHLVALEGSEH